jgi:hypothetical protein
MYGGVGGEEPRGFPYPIILARGSIQLFDLALNCSANTSICDSAGAKL